MADPRETAVAAAKVRPVRRADAHLLLLQPHTRSSGWTSADGSDLLYGDETPTRATSDLPSAPELQPRIAEAGHLIVPATWHRRIGHSTETVEG